MMFMSRELLFVYVFMCMCVGMGEMEQNSVAASWQSWVQGLSFHIVWQDPLVWGAIYKLQPSLAVSLAFGAIYVLQTSQPVSLQTLGSLPPIPHIGREGLQRSVLLSQPFGGFEGSKLHTFTQQGLYVPSHLLSPGICISMANREDCMYLYIGSKVLRWALATSFAQNEAQMRIWLPT